MATPGPSSGPDEGRSNRPQGRERGPRPAPQGVRALSVFGAEPDVALPVAAWSLTTALGVLVFALGLLPVRRRRGSDERRWRPWPAGAFRTAVAAVRSASIEPSTLPNAPGDSIRPPWLLGTGSQSNSASDAGGAIAREPLRFRDPAPPGVERRAIAYRFIRVADVPDDETSSEVCRLDRGDEVEIIGEHEGFLQVRTPNGLQGWVQRMVIVG